MQLAALEREGVHPDNVHTDKASAGARKRPGLELALKDCIDGDTLVVWRLDRLGRSAIFLLNTIETLEKRGVAVRSLTEYLDTSTPIGKFAVTMIAGMAEFERGVIAYRTKKGIEHHKSTGKKFGAEQLIDVKAARAMFRKGMTVEQVCASFRGARGRKSASRQALYRYFNAPTIWLLQGKDLRDYPRKITKEQRAAAIKAAKQK